MSPEAVTVSPSTTPFTTKVRANFKRWDLNHDGRLTAREIDSALADHALRGGDAAAIATLKLSELKSCGQTVFTPQSLADYEREMTEGRKLEPNYDSQFQACRHMISSVRQDSLAATLDHVRIAHKGRLTDCSIFSLFSTLGQYEPEQIRRMVRKVGFSEYRISPPGRPSVVLKLPSKAEIAFQSVSSKDCYWPAMVGATCNRLKPAAKSGPESLENLALVGRMFELIPKIAESKSDLAPAGGKRGSAALSDQAVAEKLAALMRI